MASHGLKREVTSCDEMESDDSGDELGGTLEVLKRIREVVNKGIRNQEDNHVDTRKQLDTLLKRNVELEDINKNQKALITRLMSEVNHEQTQFRRLSLKYMLTTEGQRENPIRNESIDQLCEVLETRKVGNLSGEFFKRLGLTNDEWKYVKEHSDRGINRTQRALIEWRKMYRGVATKQALVQILKEMEPAVLTDLHTIFHHSSWGET